MGGGGGGGEGLQMNQSNGAMVSGMAQEKQIFKLRGHIAMKF